MASEPVLAVWDYWDGVRSGVAHFDGSPHYFEQEWSAENDDYSPHFMLKPLSQEQLQEVLEQRQIFREWEFAFHQGRVPQSTHPGVPGQNARFEHLSKKLKAAFATIEPISVRVFGSFSALPGQQSLPKGVMRELQVEWRRVV